MLVTKKIKLLELVEELDVGDKLLEMDSVTNSFNYRIVIEKYFKTYEFLNEDNISDLLTVCLDTKKLSDKVVDILGLNSKDTRTILFDMFSFLNYLSDYKLQRTGYTYQLQDVMDNLDIISLLKKDILEMDYDNIYENNDKFEKLSKSFIDTLTEKSKKDSLVNLLTTGTRGSPSSLVNSFLSIGYKIDNDSSIINKFIKDNLFEGLTDGLDFYNAGIGSRNALLQSVGSVKESGYLTRKLNFLCKEVSLNLQEDFCGSDKLLKVNITKDNYKMYVNRYFKSSDNTPKLIDESVLDSTIEIYTPITCKSEGHTVCKTCYGDNYKTVTDFSNIGIFSSTILGEKTTQSLLSAKHKQFIRFQKLMKKFSDNFEFSYEQKGFIAKGETNISFTKDETSGDIYVDNELLILPFKEVSINKVIYNVGDLVLKVSEKSLRNSDMNFLLSMMKQIFDKSNVYIDINSYQQYYLEIIKFVGYAGFNIHSLHLEIILMMMTRSKSNPAYLFKQRQEEEPLICGVKNAILEGGNIFDSISFERVKETISKFRTYDTKCINKSTLEELFNNAE